MRDGTAVSGYSRLGARGAFALYSLAPFGAPVPPAVRRSDAAIVD